MPEFTSDWFSYNISAWQSFFGPMGWSNAAPKIAIDAFTTIFRDRIEIIGGQPLYQFAFYKRANRNDDDATSRGEHA